MLSVLINAYACSPGMGSEPGMAWNWCVNLAKYCELHIITEGAFREQIETIVPTLSQGKNMHFYYNPVPDKVRKMCWNQGDWRFYYYYQKWQKSTLQIARKIIASHPIDVIHQLNMIGFREPGYLWKIKNIPFVWGPVGGMEIMSAGYLEGESMSQRMKVYLKNSINSWQRKHHPRVLAAISHADAICAATQGAYDMLRNYHRVNPILINETGCYVTPAPLNTNTTNKNQFDILWVGKFDYRKQLGLALRVIAELQRDGKRINFHIVGKGSDNEERKYRKLASELGLSETVIWHGSIPHNEVLDLMSKCDLFLFTSIMEGTPHVVLEAVQNSLPIICFDACGQADVVNEKIGIKIPLSNTVQSINDFVVAIEQLINTPKSLTEMRINCMNRQTELSWDSKARQMVEIYKRIQNDSEKLVE